jgi:cytochrome c553
MSIHKSIPYACAGLICLTAISNIGLTEVNAAASSSNHKSSVEKPDNASCQTCHDSGRKEIKVAGAEGNMRPLYAIADDKYAQSVHAKMLCVD